MYELQKINSATPDQSGAALRETIFGWTKSRTWEGAERRANAHREAESKLAHLSESRMKRIYGLL